MKRWLFGIALMLVGSLSSLLATAPEVWADASGNCGPTAPCTILVVKLDKMPTSGATVRAKRQATTSAGMPAITQDNDFTLSSAGGNDTYSSKNVIFFTNSEQCLAGDPQYSDPRRDPIHVFDITVSGSATGTLGSINLCQDVDPQAVGNTKTVTVNVTLAGAAPSPYGGIDGIAQYPSPSGNGNEACFTGLIALNIDGPTFVAISTSSSTGQFKTSQTLPPGNYNITGKCQTSLGGDSILSGTANVEAGKYTKVTLTGSAPTASPSPSPSPGPGGPAIICDAGVLTWLICDAGILPLLDIADFLRDSILIPLLKEPPLSSKCNPSTCSAADAAAGKDVPAYTVWSIMRNVASIFFILVFFLVIIGTALGFDNYTIKKVLPHLVAGAILMPFSWYICAFVIDVSNVLGQGFIALVTNVVPPARIDAGDAISVAFLGAGGILAIGIAFVAFTTISFGVLATVVIALLTTVLALVIRKILIILFVILSPFALLAWVLPNTERWFSRWWTNFLRLVMLYPYVIGFIMAGRVAAVATAATFGAQVELFELPFQLAAIGIHPVFALIGQEAVKATGHLLVIVAEVLPPAIAIIKAKDWMGEAGSAVTKGVQRVGKAADDRVGQNSDLAKNLAEGRRLKNTEAAKNATDAAKKAKAQGGFGGNVRSFMLNRKAGINWSRAGMGGPPIPGMKVPIGTKLERSKAAGEAAEKLGTVDAEERQSREGDPETFKSRRRSTTQSILDKKSDERGARQGVLDAHSQSGVSPDAVTKARQRASRIDARENALGGIGTSIGKVIDDDLNERERIGGTGFHVSSSMKVAKARDIAALDASAARGAAAGVVRGSMQAEAEIEAQLAPHFAAINAARAASGLPALSAAQQAQAARDMRLRNVGHAKAITTTAEQVVNQQTANTTVSTNAELDAKTQRDSSAAGAPISLQQARQMRLRNLSAATGEHVREKIGLDEGSTDAALEVEHAAGNEHIDELVRGGRMTAREQIVNARTLRETRSRMQGDGSLTTSLSAADALDAGREEAGERLGMNIGGQKQAVEQRNADAYRAARDGLPGAAPTLENKVIAGQEAARKRTAKTSADRIAAVNAVRAGTSATTLEHTDAALFEAERGLTEADATTRGTAAAVNAKINAQAADLRAASPGLSPLAARRRAVANIRATDLGATAQVARATAVTKATAAAGSDIGGADTLNQEIDDMKAELDARPGTTVPATRAQAEAAVQARHIKDVEAASRHAGATSLSAERETAVGTNNSLKSQIIEEGNRLRREGLNPAQAEANVRARNISASGTKARLKAERDTRQATDDAIGTEDELNEEIDAQERVLLGAGVAPGAARAQAESKIRQDRLSAIGATARSKSERAARAQAGTEAGVQKDLKEQVLDRAKDLRAAALASGAPITAAEALTAAEADVRRTTLSAIGDQAEEHGSHANRKELEDAIGTQTGVETQIEEEAQRMLDSTPGLSPAAAHARAAAVIERRNLSAAGTAARTAAIANSRKTNDANIATEKELDNAINNEIIDVQRAAIRDTGAPLSPAEARRRAEAAVVQRRADSTGAAAQAKALTDARNTAVSEEAIKKNREAKNAAELSKIQSNPATAPLSPAEARRQAEDSVLDRDLTALSTVTGTAAEINAAKTDATNIEGAAAIDKLVEDEATKLANGTPVTDADRLQARRNLIAAGGTAAGLAAADKTIRDIATDVGTKNDLESQARTEQKAGESLEEAEARIREKRLTDAGNDARTKAERAASKRRGDDAGITKSQTQKTQRRAKEIVRAAAKAGRLISPAQAREQAETEIRDRELGALATKATEESARSSNKEARDAIGVEKALNAQIQQQAQFLAGPGKTPTAAQLARAAEIVDSNNLENAGAAAEIAGQDSHMEAVKKDAGTVKAHKATLKQSLVERDRNAAAKAASDAVTNRAFRDAYARALADGKTTDEARAAGEAAKAEEAVVEEALKQGKAQGEAARIAAEEAVKNGAAGYRAQDQEQAAMIAQGVAAEEQAMRAANTAQATVAGLNQAVAAPNALNADERLAAATESAVASLSAESGAARARYGLTRPGQSLNRTYQEGETSTERTQRSQIFKALVVEAQKKRIPYSEGQFEEATDDDGNPIFVKDAEGNDTTERLKVPVWEVDATGAPITKVNPVTGKVERVQKKVPKTDTIGKTDINGDSIEAMARRVRELLGDGTRPPEGEDEAAALMINMCKTNQGTREVLQLQKEIFGGTEYQNIDPTRLGGRAREVWEQVQDATDINSKPLLTIPAAALFDGYDSRKFTRSGYAEKYEYFDFANKEKKASIYREAARNIHTSLTNKQIRDELSSDDYQAMWLFLQNDDARAALNDIDGRPGEAGIDVIKTINREGIEAGARSKFNQLEVDEYNRFIDAQNATSGLAPTDPNYMHHVRVGDRKPIATDSTGDIVLDPVTNTPAVDPNVHQVDVLQTWLEAPPPPRPRP